MQPSPFISHRIAHAESEGGPDHLKHDRFQISRHASNLGAKFKSITHFGCRQRQHHNSYNSSSTHQKLEESFLTPFSVYLRRIIFCVTGLRCLVWPRSWASGSATFKLFLDQVDQLFTGFVGFVEDFIDSCVDVLLQIWFVFDFQKGEDSQRDLQDENDKKNNSVLEMSDLAQGNGRLGHLRW